MFFDGLKYKRDAIIVPDPTPHKKKSTKSPPKKSNHKHIYEPVVLSYFNDCKYFSHEHGGFVGGIDTCGGCRCTVCGRLELGFPNDFDEAANRTFFWDRKDLKVEYPNLPVVPVGNIWKLN